MPPKPGPSYEFDSSKLILQFKITIKADRKAIEPAVKRVLEAVKSMQCGEGKEAEIDLALTEALANAVVHGCCEDAAKQVECCVACDESRGMLIVVRDPGPGFDPAAIPSPTHGQNIYSSHGRGIFLINQLMDEVRFDKGGTEIHMLKR